MAVSYYFYTESIFQLGVWICLAAFIILISYIFLMNLSFHLFYIIYYFVNNNWFIEIIQFLLFKIHFREFCEFEILRDFSLSQFKMEEKLHSNRIFKFFLEIRLILLS